MVRTSWRISRNFVFSVSESVVGGSLVVTPIASFGFTGSEGRSDKIWDVVGLSLGKIY